jgi:hypothetical protein
MIKWWRARKRYSQVVKDEAERLVRVHGDGAYYAAREAARFARSRHKTQEARFLSHVAVEAAELTGKQIGLDTATRMEERL